MLPTSRADHLLREQAFLFTPKQRTRTSTDTSSALELPVNMSAMHSMGLYACFSPPPFISHQTYMETSLCVAEAPQEAREL